MSFVLDAYAARSCPLKTVNAFNPMLVAPSLERSTPSFFHDAEAVEAEVVAALAASGASLVDLRALRGSASAEHEQATAAALASGVDVVVSPLLPRDPAAHRSGRPSMLVKAPDASGYLPVQIKFHKVLETAGPDDPDLTHALLSDPRTVRPLPGRRFRWGTRLNAALQVAHYWRLLAATGFAASRPWAGLIGTDRVVLDERVAHVTHTLITWLDLAAPLTSVNPRDVEFPDTAPPISTLERYDAEHAYRVDLAERALAASGQEALLTPIVSPECSHCVWQGYCQTQLDADDLSLRISKAPLDVHEVRTLRSLGISTVRELANTDLEALLVSYLPRVSHRSGGEARLRRAHHRATLMHAGVELERQSEGPIELPTHALEIDVDIETSADDRVYLWGFLVDDGQTRTYRHFSSFADLDAATECALAGEAFTWLRELTRGRDAAVYHYSDYEVIRLNRLAARCDDEVSGWARTFAADHFVDLFDLVRQHFFGANGLGLKVVASAVTGFAWRDEDPGGLNSQRWFDEAVHDERPEVRAAAQRRVLEYNEDDVRATWHLRRWLREQPAGQGADA